MRIIANISFAGQTKILNWGHWLFTLFKWLLYFELKKPKPISVSVSNNLSVSA